MTRQEMQTTLASLPDVGDEPPNLWGMAVLSVLVVLTLLVALGVQ